MHSIRTCLKIYCLFKIKLIMRDRINSIPNDNILDWSKLKAFADDKITVT